MQHLLPRATAPRLRRAVLAVAAGVLALSGCSSLEGTGSKGYVSADGNVQQIAEDDRGKVVELSGTDLDGNDIALSDFAGKPVVVNVWWSACPPCRKEQPELNEAAAALEGVAQFVGINIRDSAPDQAKGYLRKFGVTYPSFYSPDGKALLPFSGTVPPNAIPSTVVLDEEGRVAAAIIGSIPSALTLVGVVEEVAGVDVADTAGDDAKDAGDASDG